MTCRHAGCPYTRDLNEYNKLCTHHQKEFEANMLFDNVKDAPSGVWLCSWCQDQKPTQKDWERIDFERIYNER